MTILRLLAAWLMIVVFADEVYSQEGIELFTKDFPPEEFAQRRSAVYDAVGPDAAVLIQGLPSPAGYVRFRQSNEFYYLCGIEVPDAYLLLDAGQRRASLYLPHRNEQRERSEGKLLSADDADLIRDLSGIDRVFGIEMLGEHLARLRGWGQSFPLYTPFQPAEGMAMSRDLAIRANTDAAADPWNEQKSREQAFLQLIRHRLPHCVLHNLSPVLDSLRLIKSDREIELIRKSTRLSGLALMEAMRSTEPGIKEYELDAVAKFVYFRNGAQGEAYYSLVASGVNAWYPHYNAGLKTMHDGELILMDFGPDYQYYMADVTRMWPVNGTFNSWQRELYGFYLDCYNAILAEIKPGSTAAEIKRRAARAMEEILRKSSFSSPSHRKASEAFVSNYAQSASYATSSLGHWVGMSTHDVGKDSGPLRAGMVFTIEPALRVPEENIYIRLEDMIVITPNGAEVISNFVPRDIEGIETIMREQGVLQTHPRDAMFPEQGPIR